MERSKESAVIHHGVIHLAGQLADDLSGDIRQQTRETLAAIDRRLAEAGSDKTRILSATIYLRDIDADFAGMNAEWDAWVAPGAVPVPLPLPRLRGRGRAWSSRRRRRAGAPPLPRRRGGVPDRAAAVASLTPSRGRPWAWPERSPPPQGDGVPRIEPPP